MTKSLPLLHPLIDTRAPFDLSVLMEHAPPERWSPEEGERIIGELISVRTKVAFGAASPVMALLIGEDRYVLIRCSGVVLKRFVEESAPTSREDSELGLGDDVAIRFNGMVLSRANREYRHYDVALRRADTKRWIYG